MRGVRFGRGLATIAFVIIAAEAEGHRAAEPRTAQLAIEHGVITLALSLDVDPGYGARECRQRFDRDADGRLDAAERAALTDYLALRAELGVALAIGEAPIRWTKRESAPFQLGGAAGSAEGLGVHLVLQAALPEQAAIELRAECADAALPLAIDLGPEYYVAFASQGELHARAGQIERVRLAPGRPLRLRLRRRPPASSVQE